jgi:hypothetical protein
MLHRFEMIPTKRGNTDEIIFPRCGSEMERLLLVPKTKPVAASRKMRGEAAT